MTEPTNAPAPTGDVTKRLDDELTQPPADTAAAPVDPTALKQEAQERAKQRPLIQKILALFTKKEKGAYRELIINSEPLEKRVALLQDGILDKFEIERESDDRMVGGIYKGKVKNLDPGLKAAFVDIGFSKNAFLHYWDILPAAADSSVEVVRINKSSKQNDKAKVTLKDIPGLYPPGTEIVVQVTKGPIGTKGPRTTTNLSLPGRFLVLMPYSDQCGISRKIEDPKERQRLKKMLQELTIPEGMGVIVRTAGEGKKTRYFVRDLHILLKKWEEIARRMAHDKPPSCLYQEPDIVERTVRDFLTEDVDRVLIDNQKDYENVQEIVGLISKRSRAKIHYYNDTIPIFERFNIERQIEQTFNRHVQLPSGGQIVIDETEALVAIDVNTGSHKAKSGEEKNTIFQVNMEAAVEIARQIRLRNMGGLIIMDFIDMKERKHRNQVYEKMVDAMSEDKAKNHVLPISTLGIMQMTRQRQQESLASNLYTDCPYCRGRGIVKSATTMSVELQRRLGSIARRLQTRHPGKEFNLRVLVHPSVLERLKVEDADLLVRMEKNYGMKLSFRADPAYHVENYKVINAVSNEEYR